MTNSQPRVLRIFISSPGDVSIERGIALEVIDRLTDDPALRYRVVLQPVAWESGAPMLANMTPQEAINQGLPRPSECDIVVVIFWSRMGTPLPPDYTRPDGSRYLSGTHWEYEDALRAAHSSLDRPVRPQVLVYRRTEKLMLDPSDLEFMEKYQQWQRVQDFFKSFTDADGTIRQGYNSYGTVEQFRADLETHLRAVIDRLVEAPPPGHTTEFRSLIDELERPTTPHFRRAVIGDKLAEIGDLRDGVGLDANGLPSPAWCEVPGGIVTIEGQEFAVEPFCIARYPVTYIQYRAFLQAPDGFRNPRWWRLLDRRTPAEPGVQTIQVSNHPATNLSWHDAAAFCLWLSARLADLGEARIVRMPTEAEWQLAACGGSPANEYPWGSGWDDSRASSFKSTHARTLAVGMYPHGCAPCGALDMSGNVWEWCGNEYATPHQINLTGKGERALRGGSANSGVHKLRTTYRADDKPGRRTPFIGFRVACDRQTG